MPVVVVAVAAAWWQWRWGKLGGNTAVDMASIGAAVAAQRRWWRYQCCKVAAWQHDGSNTMRTRYYKVCNNETMMKQSWWRRTLAMKEKMTIHLGNN
jgi:hypothetical protein